MRKPNRVWTVVLMIAVLQLSGCRKRNAAPKEDDAADGGRNPIAAAAAGGAPAQSHVLRGAQKRVNENDLGQLAVYYTEYQSLNGRPPKSADEFKAYVKSDLNARHLTQVLDEGNIVVVPNAQLSSTSIIAHEKQAFALRNNRVVAFGDGHVETMQDEDFQRIIKAQLGQ